MPETREVVYVATDVDAGAFPGEKLVTIETDEGAISGFAKDDSIITENNKKYLKAEFRGISQSSMTVLLFGSFFTTTGLASIPKDRVLKGV
jgi:hypothetical protein